MHVGNCGYEDNSLVTVYLTLGVRNIKIQYFNSGI